MAAAFVVPEFDAECGKRINDDVSVFACERMAMIMALQWVEDIRPERGSCIRFMCCIDELTIQ